LVPWRLWVRKEKERKEAELRETKCDKGEGNERKEG
jgi:hypothetical protein